MTRVTSIGIKRAYVNASPPPEAVDVDEPAPAENAPPKKKRKHDSDAEPPAKKTYKNKAIAERAQRSEQRRLQRISERDADTTCFACREKGHAARFCPKTKGQGGNKTAVGICYRCGSMRHSLKRCRKPHDPESPLPFATCFVCSGTGHLASACPDNQDKGIYPNGGCCKLCGETSHLAKDCALRKPDVKPAAVIGFVEAPGADEDDFHTLRRLDKQLDRAERVDGKKKKLADVKTGAHSGVTKSFGPAPTPSIKKKVVNF
ncbi:hypothetical protein BD626DRAFT_563952 [Schizophyllum amplum]|uniref:CCHC-type domain-containing protein n=1 Tax=Schizophyllum amplum TaxID=97359 RepID=A0A550CZU4_9AGAR|nr:hypothetical protein BD626DRAFT_563952 [Auriculariopsis ampla]